MGICSVLLSIQSIYDARVSRNDLAKNQDGFSIVSLTAYVLTKVSVTVYAGALVFQTLLPDTLVSSKCILGGSNNNGDSHWTLYCSRRIKSCSYTDLLQTIILLIGSTAITYFGLIELGGFNEFKGFASENVAQYALWRPLSDPDFPWLEILIASLLLEFGIGVQINILSREHWLHKDLKTARRGALLGAFFKVWPVLIFLVPGLIGAALNAKGILEISIDTNGKIIGDQVFPTMVATLLPEGLRGLVVAGIIAAL